MTDIFPINNTKQSIKMELQNYVVNKRLSYESDNTENDITDTIKERKLEFKNLQNSLLNDGLQNYQYLNKQYFKEAKISSSYINQIGDKSEQIILHQQQQQQQQQKNQNHIDQYQKNTINNIKNNNQNDDQQRKEKLDFSKYSIDLQKEKAKSQDQLSITKKNYNIRQEENGYQQLYPQNLQLKKGSKYLDIIRRRETLKIMNKPSESQLILQYDKYMNTHIYDNKFITQRQKQVKQDFQLYNSDYTTEMNNSQTKNLHYKTITNTFKKNSIKEFKNKQIQSQLIQEESNGFNSERLHNQETQLLSRKNNEQIKERNKFRKNKYSISTNQNELSSQRNRESLEVPFSAASPLQNSVLGTYRSRFFEKNNEGNFTSRHSIVEDQKANEQQPLLVKSSRIDNLNDDFHRMSFSQKQAYYKQEKFNKRTLSNIKLGYHSIGNDSVYKNEEKDNQPKNIFKEFFDKQKIIQNFNNFQDESRLPYELNNNNNNNNESQQTNKQPSSEQIQSKENISNKMSSQTAKRLQNCNSADIGDFLKQSYLRRNVLETRKKIALQKDLQEQVIKLAQLKNPQEYKSIYKLLNLNEDISVQKAQQKCQISSEISLPLNYQNISHLPNIQTPQKISLLILSSQIENDINNQINNGANNQLTKFKNYSSNGDKQKEQNEKHPQINQLIEYGISNQNSSKQITKDEYLSDWVSGLQGLEIEHHNIINEGEDEEEEVDLNFFLKSQQVSQQQKRGNKDSQISTRTSKGRDLQKSQQISRNQQQSDSQITKTTLKILSYQTNKTKQELNKIGEQDNNQPLIINQIKTSKQILQPQINSSDKGISISSFENLEKDNQNSTQKQMKYISHISNSLENNNKSDNNNNNNNKGKSQSQQNIQGFLNEKQLPSQANPNYFKDQDDKFVREEHKNKIIQQVNSNLPTILDGKQMQIYKTREKNDQFSLKNNKISQKNQLSE